MKAQFTTGFNSVEANERAKAQIEEPNETIVHTNKHTDICYICTYTYVCVHIYMYVLMHRN